MSYTMLLRYRRNYRHFWSSLDGFLDMPLGDRALLMYLCDHVLDEAGRVQLNHRTVTSAMLGADGAADVIALAKRCEFVCVYVVDGKDYAAVPCLAMLATKKQRKTAEASLLPAPPESHEDAAMVLARQVRKIEEDGDDESESKPSVGRDNGSVGRSKRAVGRSKLDDGRDNDTDARPKSELGASNATVGTPNAELGASKSADGPRARDTLAHDRARHARATQPNPMQPSNSAPPQGGAAVTPTASPSTDARATSAPPSPTNGTAVPGVASAPALGGAGSAPEVRAAEQPPTGIPLCDYVRIYGAAPMRASYPSVEAHKAAMAEWLAEWRARSDLAATSGAEVSA